MKNNARKKPLIIFLMISVFSQAQQVIQIDVKSILTTRSVTTFSGGSISIWKNGVDLSNGYMTLSAATATGSSSLKALPDDGVFPATERHPQIVLNYNNNDNKSNQTLYVTGIGGFTFPVPEKCYSQLMLSLTSAAGSSGITVTLNYTDATETKTFTVPDYYNDIVSSNVNWFYVAHDLGKWSKGNVLVEAGHHNIDGLNIWPNPSKILKSITVQKPATAGYLVFWGATGIEQSGTDISQTAMESVSVYPNPANEVVNINFILQNKYSYISFFDVTGKTVLKTTVEAQKGNCIINTSTIISGVYQLVINDENLIRTAKIHIVH
jgi:hypothetical protein